MSTLKEQLIRLGALSPDTPTQEKSSSFYSKSDSNSSTRSSNRRKSNSRNGNPRQSSRHRTTHPRSHRARTNGLEASQRRELSPEERKKEIKKLFSQARMPFPPAGAKRFYFELKNGEIDFIEMDHSDFQAFSNAEFSVVEDFKVRLSVLNQKALFELYALDPDWVPKSV